MVMAVMIRRRLAAALGPAKSLFYPSFSSLFAVDATAQKQQEKRRRSKHGRKKQQLAKIRRMWCVCVCCREEQRWKQIEKDVSKREKKRIRRESSEEANFDKREREKATEKAQVPGGGWTKRKKNRDHVVRCVYRPWVSQIAEHRIPCFFPAPLSRPSSLATASFYTLFHFSTLSRCTNQQSARRRTLRSC